MKFRAFLACLLLLINFAYGQVEQPTLPTANLVQSAAQVQPSAPMPEHHSAGFMKFIMLTDFDEKMTPKKGGGAITYGILTALDYQQATIFTTNSLVYNVLYGRQLIQDFAHLDHDALAEKYPADYEALGKENAQKLIELAKLIVAGNGTSEQAKKLFDEVNELKGFDALPVYIACFIIKLDQFQLFQVDTDNYFCLLVPKSSLGSAALAQVAEGQITELEFKIGLKVNHLAPREVASITKKTEAPNKKNALYEARRKIFVLSQEYHKAKKQSLELAAINVYVGHGSPAGSQEVEIAGVVRPEFALIMKEDNDDRTTAFTSIDSCYSAGQNMQDLMKSTLDLLGEEKKLTPEMQKLLGVEKMLSYVVTASATAENVSTVPRLKVKIGETIAIVSTPNYAAYFNYLTAKKPDIIRALNALVPFASEDLSKITDPHNIPVVMIPGMKVNYVVNLIGAFAIIDEDIIKDHGSQEPLNIAKQFGKNGKKPDAILLYVANIPFPLAIDYRLAEEDRVLPYFISLIAGSAVHKIEEINIPQATDEEFLESLTHYPVQSAKKILWIKKLTSKSATLTDVVFFNKPISSDEHEHIIYYTEEGKHHRMSKKVSEGEESEGLKAFKQIELKKSYVPIIEAEIKKIETPATEKESEDSEE